MNRLLTLLLLLSALIASLRAQEIEIRMMAGAAYGIPPKENTSTNSILRRAVFEELRMKTPAGLRYMVLRHGDGRFVHFVEQRDGAPALSDFATFRAFQKDASDRFQVRPEANEVQIVGSYGIELDVA